VLLVSPPETHRPLGEEALARGLHVLSEKPLARTLADARALAATAERTGSG
jgi:predicted dehydrogenase